MYSVALLSTVQFMIFHLWRTYLWWRIPMRAHHHTPYTLVPLMCLVSILTYRSVLLDFVHCFGTCLMCERLLVVHTPRSISSVVFANIVPLSLRVIRRDLHLDSLNESPAEDDKESRYSRSICKSDISSGDFMNLNFLCRPQKQVLGWRWWWWATKTTWAKDRLLWHRRNS